MMMLFVFSEGEAGSVGWECFQSCTANIDPVTPNFCCVFLKLIIMF